MFGFIGPSIPNPSDGRAFPLSSDLHHSRRFRSLSMQVMIIGTLVAFPIHSSAQLCKGSNYSGCSHEGAACSPVEQGTGDSGHCQTVNSKVPGEKSCECFGQPSPPPPRLYAFDLLSQGTDANGYFLNPVWTSQVDMTGQPSLANPPFRDASCIYSDPWNSDCTTWSPQKIDQGLHYPECTIAVRAFGGRGQNHYNWTEATYEGQVWYDEFANDDNDINLKLRRFDNAGLTVWNEDALQLEFNAAEIEFTTTWWKSFWNAAYREREARNTFFSCQAQFSNNPSICNPLRQAMNDTRKAAKQVLCKPTGSPIVQDIEDVCPNGGSPIQGIVIGTLGLDCVHSCGSEIHPVFALALHVKDDPDDDVWAVFARNFGNEGYCSTGWLYRPDYNNVIITLPWRLGGTLVTNPGNVYGNAELISSEGAGWSRSGKPTRVYSQVNPLSGIAIRVASDAPVISTGGWSTIQGAYWVEFELHYKWTRPQPVKALSAEQRERLRASQIPAVKKIPAHSKTEREAEPEKRDLHLTPADLKARRAILEEVKPVQVTPVSVQVVGAGTPMGREVRRGKLARVQPSNNQARVIPNSPEKDAADKRAEEILRRAHPELAH